MSHAYRAVGWNAQKRAYDAVAVSLASAVVGIVAAGTWWRMPQVTIETALIRGFGVAAFALLHVVLSIGPLCRLDARLLPLLYNRRHLGVLVGLLASAHGVFALVQFHASGNENLLVSALTTSNGWTSAAGFPFQVPGLVALLILLAMAATSHDFWLRTLTPPVWKTLHMLVYVAYAGLVTHVAFGVLQSEVPTWAGVIVGAGVSWLAAVHTAAACVEARKDRGLRGEWLDVCDVEDIPEKRARIACVAGERVAIFKYAGFLSAVSNVCQHQNGPLGEGKIVGGCIVCPWHGYEYRPDTGASPPPFTEAVPTFRLRLSKGRVLVHREPLPPGTRIEPVRIGT